MCLCMNGADSRPSERAVLILCLSTFLPQSENYHRYADLQSAGVTENDPVDTVIRIMFPARVAVLDLFAFPVRCYGVLFRD